MSTLGGFRDRTGAREQADDGEALEPRTVPLKTVDRKTVHRNPVDRNPVDREPVDREPVDRGPVAPGRRRPVVPKAVWAAVVVAVLIIAGAVATRVVMGGLAALNPFSNGVVQQRTVDRSGPAVLKAVTDLGTLQSAGGYYEIVIDVERSIDHVPAFLVGRRALFVAAGTVDAGVELKGLDAGAVTVDAARTTATLRLPAPRLSEPHLDLGRSYLYSEDRGIVDRIGDAVQGAPQDQKQLYVLASQRLAQAAATNGDLVNRAEANARTVLTGLLRPLGFTDVTVTFAPAT